jgi:Protein of unknown function (DUF2934)
VLVSAKGDDTEYLQGDTPMPTKSSEATATPKRRKPAVKKTAPAQPSQEQIALLAEKYWAERGWPEGSPEQDWLRAEQELKSA